MSQFIICMEITDVNLNEKKYTSTEILLYISIFIIINLILISIWIFTATKDQNFFSHFSFASTVASIILSVLAIFMSVMGESKTEIIRDRIEQEAKEIVAVTKKFENNMDSLLKIEEKMDDIKADIKTVINKNPEIHLASADIDSSDIRNNKFTLGDNHGEKQAINGNVPKYDKEN